ERLRARAEALAAGLEGVEAVDCESAPGGGSVPGVVIPSAGVAVAGSAAAEVLRAGDPPVVARVDRGRLLLDLRTVDPADDEAVAGALRAALDG
ncbi:MAG: L-seryl-tRNA(Sec) selenium transferase, partial [Vicinamibacteria bacterium]